MNGKMNKIKVTVVRKYEFDKPLIHKMDSILDSCFRDCHSNYFHKIKYDCIYDIILTKITNKETFNLTIADQSLNIYELNKKSKMLNREVS